MSTIVILGPAHPLRGGIAAFNERLARELQQMGHQVTLYSFSLQYPSVLFPGKSQYSDSPPPNDLSIKIKVNSINPFNWLHVGLEIKKLRPDLIITRFWIPFMGPSLGSILRIIRKNKHTRIVCIADNVIPHEKRPGDKMLTKYFLHACDAFIAMSKPVKENLNQLIQKPTLLIPHPLYDQFGETTNPQAARRKLRLPETGKWVLFFGFIRRYKGLDLLLEAMSDPRIQQQQIRLLVAGEFYEKEDPYQQLIEKLQLQSSVYLHDRFIPDNEVKYYFSATDVVVLPYRTATQSGIAPMAYHFEKPMIATDTGGLPDTIHHGETGLLCSPGPTSIAEAILTFYEMGEKTFLPYLQTQKQTYSWQNMAKGILKLGLPS